MPLPPRPSSLKHLVYPVSSLTRIVFTVILKLIPFLFCLEARVQPFVDQSRSKLLFLTLLPPRQSSASVDPEAKYPWLISSTGFCWLQIGVCEEEHVCK